MQVGVVIELDERLKRDVEAFAIIEQRAVMIGNAPWPRIDVKAIFELANLGEPSKLGKAVAAAQRPVATAGTRVELEQLNLVAGLAQLQRRGQAGQSGTEDQD